PLQQHQPPMVTKRSDDRAHDVPPDCCGKTDEAGRLRPLTGERVCVPLSTLGDVGREYSGPNARTSAPKRSCDRHAAVDAAKGAGRTDYVPLSLTRQGRSTF